MADPIKKYLDEVLARHLQDEAWRCPECTALTAADEDGCCAQCGEDCEVVTNDDVPRLVRALLEAVRAIEGVTSHYVATLVISGSTKEAFRGVQRELSTSLAHITFILAGDGKEGQ